MHVHKMGAMRRVTFALLAAGLSFLSSSTVAAQTCFPTPVALPGLSGPPNWLGAGVVRTELNEPRWAAAPQTPFALNGALGAEGWLRVMTDAGFTQLSVSFQAPTDLDSASGNDIIYFGFTTDGVTGMHARAVSIPVAPASMANPNPVPITAGIVEHVYDGTQPAASRWTSTPGIPAWLVTPASWTDDPTAAWGINFKMVFADAGLTAATPFSNSTSFKIMFAMHKRDEGTATTETDPNLQPSVNMWTPAPPNATAAGVVPSSDLLAGTLVILEPTAWATATAVNAGCASGVTISGNQIGTRNVDPVTSAPRPNIIDTTDTHVNRFYAEPTFPGGTPSIGAIEAKFHIANWGSIAASNAPWSLIPGGEAVRNGTATPSTEPPPPPGTIEFACAANTATTTCDMPVPAEDHQCVYVELRAITNAAGTLAITRAAAYRNMDFAPLSEHSSAAEISVKGLREAFGNEDPRDVYLYVHTRNMPAHQNDPVWLQTDKMAATRRFAEVPAPSRPMSPRERDLARRQPTVPRAMALPKTGIGDQDLNAHQALSAVWPTYDVHVYYDSGKTIGVGKNQARQLIPMFPFTTFYSHEGPLYGFSHKLEGIEGAKVKEVRPGVYRLRIASEGIAKIKTSATAHETPKAPMACPKCEVCPPPEVPRTCGCSTVGASSRHLGVGMLIASVLIAVLWRRRVSAHRR